MKSWKDIRADVKNMKTHLQNAKNNIPTCFSFSEDGERLFFLGVGDVGREQGLYSASLNEEIVKDQNKWSTPWTAALDAPKTRVELSKEEELLRERMRVGSSGISSYQHSTCRNGNMRFLFSSSGTLNIADVSESSLTTCAKPIPSDSQGTRMDFKFCPYNSNIVSFIKDNEIWVSDLESSETLRLTHATESGKMAGVAEFIIQEEFDRYTGYWWQPNDGSGTMRILYVEVDESHVECFNIHENNLPGSVDKQKYPRAGTANAIAEIRVVEFSLDSIKSKSKTVIRLPYTLKSLFPWHEYVVRCGWTPCGGDVWCQIISRNQQQLNLLAIPLKSFCDTKYPSDVVDNSAADKLGIEVLVEETSSVWVNVHNLLTFILSDDRSFRFFWASEETGFRHLYLISKPRGSDVSASSKVSLTAGDWQVEPLQIWFDAKRSLVYFVGTKDSDVELHLYVISVFDQTLGNRSIKRLTPLGYSHSITMDKKCDQFVSVYSNVSTPHVTSVFQIKQCPSSNDKSSLPEAIKRKDIYGSYAPTEYTPPTIFDYTSRDGILMHGAVFKPADFDSGKKYPTVCFVYGGPCVQQVTNEFKAMRLMRVHFLAKHGFVVVMIDSRGSSRRGLAFEGHIRCRMGQTEIADQVEGIEHLMKTGGYIDPGRISIHGWSYGGYLSLMGLCQRPDFFKVAISGAPVTEWEAYDTGYTERYMDLPGANPEGYKKGAVKHYLSGFPDEENRLFIIHGLIDENVHFNNATMLINDLICACKPYSLQIYPTERHGVRRLGPSEHYETLVISILLNNL
eukprot:Nk52_evm4s1810 gene=Nk52_evmTU4s1810